MDKYLFFIEDYLKGKPIYSIIRRILDFLFTASISSFLFEKFYFKYHWLDITDYKSILDFIIRGHFFIPFCIFILVGISLKAISFIIFSLTTHNISSKLLNKIIRFQLNAQKIDSLNDKINNNPAIELPIEFTKSAWVKVYEEIKKSMPLKKWKKAEIQMREMKQEMQANFNLAFKALFVSLIYFITIKYFGLVLFVTIILLLLILLVGFWLAYLFLEIFPVGIKKIDSEVVKYFGQQKEQELESQ